RHDARGRSRRERRLDLRAVGRAAGPARGARAAPDEGGARPARVIARPLCRSAGPAYPPRVGTRAMAARLAEERQRAFVGREIELEHFAQALESAAFAVLFVHGPGGVGKSTLLARFEDEARERQR